METLILIIVVLVIVIMAPIASYICGFMFGRGFMSSMTKYVNKFKSYKNEQKESQ